MFALHVVAVGACLDAPPRFRLAPSLLKVLLDNGVIVCYNIMWCSMYFIIIERKSL